MLAGVWAGLLVGCGAIGAPAGFAVVTSDVAGRVAGRIFAVEARTSVVLGLLLMSLAFTATEAQRSRLSRLSVSNAQFTLPLIAVLCTLVGYDVMQPLMAEARAGRGPWSFGMLHGASALLFAIKTLVVIALAWRLTAHHAASDRPA